MGKISGKKYTVKTGDSLSKIAANYGASWKQIYELNREMIGDNPNVIRSGMELLIPEDSNSSNTGTGSAGSGTGRYGPDKGPTKYANGDFKPPYYTVDSGDTLISIGLRFNVQWQVIAKENKIKGDLIHTGQKLKILGW